MSISQETEIEISLSMKILDLKMQFPSWSHFQALINPKSPLQPNQTNRKNDLILFQQNIN